MTQLNFGVKEYFKPTPKGIRKIADSLLAVSTFLGSLAIINGYGYLGMASTVLGVVGKFLSNFYSDSSAT